VRSIYCRRAARHRAHRSGRVQPAAAAPAAPAPVKVAVSDAGRRTEIEAMMRTVGGKGYWNNPDVQAEYNQVLARLAGEAPAAFPANPARRYCDRK
jgi:hypothetical protein